MHLSEWKGAPIWRGKGIACSFNNLISNIQRTSRFKLVWGFTYCEPLRGLVHHAVVLVHGRVLNPPDTADGAMVSHGVRRRWPTAQSWGQSPRDRFSESDCRFSRRTEAVTSTMHNSTPILHHYYLYSLPPYTVDSMGSSHALIHALQDMYISAAPH